MDTSSRRRRIVLAAAMVLGTLLIAGLATAGIILWVERSSGPKEPLASLTEGTLPAKVSRLSQTTALNTWPQYRVPKAVDDASLARTFCDGVDIASKLVKAKGADLTTLESKGIMDLLAHDGLGRALRCGSAIRDHVVRPALGVVRFKHRDDKRKVFLLRSKFHKLPLQRHSFRGLEGFCRQSDQKDADCAEDHLAAAHTGKLWAAGPFPDVKAFVREWTSDRQTATTDVRIARSLTSTLEPADETRVIVKPDQVAFQAACFQVGPRDEALEFTNHCWPDDLDETLKSIVAEVRGYSLEGSFPFRDGEVRFVYRMLSRDEQGARDLTQATRDLTRDWKAHLENRDADLVEIVRGLDDDDRSEAYGAVLQAFLRGAADMTVVRDGRMVELRIEAALRDPERKAVKPYVQKRSRDLQVASRIVAALQKDEEVARKDLAHFVGQDVARWMLLPRASKSDCTELRQHFDAIVEAGVEPEQYGAKFRMEKRLGDGACVGSPLPPKRKQCLLKATDVASMASCPEPLSPFERYARAQLQGKWKVAEVEKAYGMNYFQRQSLKGRPLQVDGDRIAWGEDPVRLGRLRLRARSTDSFSFDLPGKDDNTLRVVAKPNAMEGVWIQIESEDGKFRFSITPGYYERSLLASSKGTE
jgi:hypothetical protein